MAQFDNIQSLLEDFKDNVIREAKSNLKTKGNLNNSLEVMSKNLRTVFR